MTNLARAPRIEHIEERIVVGKDVLELVSGAMYLDPLTIFREYVQNAADAIDEAEAEQLYALGSNPRIDIRLDLASRNIRIRDNGIGVCKKSLTRTLTSLGASKKRGSKARGFRGIGRLAGLAYCQVLIFRTKSAQDTKVTELHWDCRLLKQMLHDHSVSHTLDDIVKTITSVHTVDADGFPSHFFEVELRDVIRYKNDLLLNERAVECYLGEVGPAPFTPSFSFGSKIAEYLGDWGIDRSYRIFLNGRQTPIYRPHLDEFASRVGITDKFVDLERFQLDGLSEDVVAVGWILHHGYQGALSEKLGFKGLRVRKGNIQIGSDNIFDGLFHESRFNAWCVGEIHILSKNVIPNGRRDSFDHNRHFLHIESQLRPITNVLAKRCRTESQIRQKDKISSKAVAAITSEQEKLLKKFSNSKANAYREIIMALYKVRGTAAKDLVSSILHRL